MPVTEYCVIMTTCASREEAEKIKDALLTEQLVACANIINSVSSFFWWEGKIDSTDEVLMVVKTTRNLFDRVRDRIVSVHSYSVPEIIALPIITGHAPYLQWIADSVKNK